MSDVSPIPEPSVPLHVDQLLESRSIIAGVEALKRRNQHHMADMDDEERENAQSMWAEMVSEILHSVRAELSAAVPADGPGRAVFVLSDDPNEPGQIQAEAIFTPEIQEVEEDGETQVIATFAQVLGMRVAEILPELAQAMAGGDENAEDDEG